MRTRRKDLGQKLTLLEYEGRVNGSIVMDVLIDRPRGHQSLAITVAAQFDENSKCEVYRIYRADGTEYLPANFSIEEIKKLLAKYEDNIIAEYEELEKKYETRSDQTFDEFALMRKPVLQTVNRSSPYAEEPYPERQKQLEGMRRSFIKQKSLDR